MKPDEIFYRIMQVKSDLNPSSRIPGSLSLHMCSKLLHTLKDYAFSEGTFVLSIVPIIQPGAVAEFDGCSIFIDNDVPQNQIMFCGLSGITFLTFDIGETS